MLKPICIFDIFQQLVIWWSSLITGQTPSIHSVCNSRDFQLSAALPYSFCSFIFIRSPTCLLDTSRFLFHEASTTPSHPNCPHRFHQACYRNSIVILLVWQFTSNWVLNTNYQTVVRGIAPYYPYNWQWLCCYNILAQFCDSFWCAHHPQLDLPCWGLISAVCGTWHWIKVTPTGRMLK